MISAIASKAYQILRSRRVSRAPPSFPEKIQESLDATTWHAHQPLEIYLLWGGSKESPSRRADEADREALERLSCLTREINGLLEPADGSLETRILFCDWHHRVANGKDADAIRAYGEDVRHLAVSSGLFFVYLSDFYTPGVSCKVSLASALNSIGDPAIRAKTDALFLQEGFRKIAEEAAIKHSDLVKRGASAELAARIYVQMELDFLSQLRRAERVFASFSDPSLQRPISEAVPVPMLYLHSFGPGHHECPWYTTKHA